MDLPLDHLTLEEIGRRLRRLGPADVVRLTGLARLWSRKLGPGLEDDLLNEALARTLSGDRRWPVDVPLAAFLSQVMRSIAGEWRRDQLREPRSLDDEDVQVADEACSPERETAYRHLASRIRQMLADDPIALGIFDLAMTDTAPDAIQKALGINATVYDTARRRLRRHLLAAYPDGFPL